MKEIVASGEVAFGTFSALKEPAIVEMLGYAGYDFTIIDMEHSATDLADVEQISRAAGMVGLTPFVRVPRGDFNTALRLVENGIPGVLAPHITTADDAENLVAVTKYYPVGDRGMDPTTRSARYGVVEMKEHMRASDDVWVVVLIEDKLGIDNIDEILSVKGIDAAFCGPSDLSRSLGHPGEYDHPAVVEAVDYAHAKFKEYGVHTGRAAFSASDVASHVKEGARLITTPIVDTYFISNAFKAHLEQVKAGIV